MDTGNSDGQVLMTHYKNCRRPAEVYAPSVHTVSWKSCKSKSA